jgi:uncharacterized protein with HEPN domain
MLDHAREALDMVRDAVRADLDTDRKLNLALVRLLEILGEAATGCRLMNNASILRSPGLS